MRSRTIRRATSTDAFWPRAADSLGWSKAGRYSIGSPPATGFTPPPGVGDPPRRGSQEGRPRPGLAPPDVHPLLLDQPGIAVAHQGVVIARHDHGCLVGGRPEDLVGGV